MPSTQIGFRIDEGLKEAAYAKLDELGVTPTDLFRDVLQYVVMYGKLPVRRVIVSNTDD